jgi:hypothetical protein
VASTDIDSLCEAIGNLPRAERLKVIERVIHEMRRLDDDRGLARDPRAVIGSMAEYGDLVDQVSELAMAARERDPLRRPGG